MTAPRSRRALVAGAAGFAAAGGMTVFALMNALGGGSPVVNFTPAAATNDAPTTVAPKSSTDPATGDHAGCDHQPLDDATTAKVKASAEKAVSGATFDHADHDRANPSGYVAMMEKADGTHVLVHEDANFTVTKVEDPAPQRGPGGPGDHHRGGYDPDGDHGGTTPTTAAAS